MPKPLNKSGGEVDKLFKRSVKLVIPFDRVGSSLLQRKLSIGYVRSEEIMKQLEKAGVVGPRNNYMTREVLIHSYEELSSKDKK